MPVFDNVEQLNKHLENNSYVNGYVPSQQDAATFTKIGSEPDAKYPHAARWYRHIASYDAEARAAWGGEAAAEAPAKAEEKTEAKADAGDDDVDLFGDDEEDEEWEKERARRAKELEDKRAAEGKTKPVAKSAVILDVKPIDDETDMAELERLVREIQMEGLEWKVSKLVDVAYGIKKLQINAVIIDDLVSMEEVEELITANEEVVQSVDIVAFNKL
eukprot:TRINITY_DN628_c0_g1_i1.p1 TRINITY_DN628_c0_g1~~TRINITY_DN628_c0_g1_i1.p1  ORF type:complete len:217 (-),score=84.90 TRINITY_DN628_c0_g1_i1:59-709(-)